MKESKIGMLSERASGDMVLMTPGSARTSRKHLLSTRFDAGREPSAEAIQQAKFQPARKRKLQALQTQGS